MSEMNKILTEEQVEDLKEGMDMEVVIKQKKWYENFIPKTTKGKIIAGAVGLGVLTAAGIVIANLVNGNSDDIIERAADVVEPFMDSAKEIVTDEVEDVVA